MRLTPTVPGLRSLLSSSRVLPAAALLALACLLLHPASHAQTTPQSAPESSSSTPASAAPDRSSPGPRIGQLETTGSGVTLENSEPLFDLAAALNTCGYDADLSDSVPVRTVIRDQVATAAASSPEIAAHRDALCAFLHQHTLADSGRNIAQYISLALFLSPDLMPTADETELPPDSAQVLTILPLLRTFAEDVHLRAIFAENHPAYEALSNQIHDPLTQMILNTNLYLRSPLSSYDGRRFLVLLEPMLAPSTVNARIYGSSYIIVLSPSAAGSFHLEQIRHTYLHYQVEPLVYARAAAIGRLQPLLKSVANAPIEFTYKSDIVALIAECLIKSIEVRTMDTGITPPVKPTTIRQRAEMEHYDAEHSVYERQVEAARRRTVDLSMHQGWILTEYFYNQLVAMERDGVSLKDNIGPMVYGMDVERERHATQNIAFLPETTHEVVRRVAPAPTGLRLAEQKLLQGDAHTASEIASKALADPAADHGAANYILGRIDLLERAPEDAVSHFEAALRTGKDPHTLAWSHIYLGRLYDIQPDRKRAVAEYQAALAVHDPAPDSRTAANTGIRAPFALPRREAVTPAQTDRDDEPIDPTGKAEKDSYKPPK